MAQLWQVHLDSDRSSRHWIAALITLLALFLFSTDPAIAAGGSYDEQDPFRELDRIERLKRLGWDLSKELDVEFYFDFADRIEAREHNAQTFAAKLRRMGYPQASAQQCRNEKACWYVVAPKRLRIDSKKLIALGKQLDQLAADDYGRYDGWGCELFNKEDERVLSPLPGSLNSTGKASPTPAVLIAGLEQAFGIQCLRISENAGREAEGSAVSGKTYEAYGLRRVREMVCQCLPDRARQARLALLPAERDLQLNETEFTQLYALPKIIQPCVADMVRKIYGEDCAGVATGLKANAANYCPCMQSVIADLSEAEVTQLGLESADYIPRVAQAQSEGRSPPEPPPLYKKFTEKEAICRR